VTAAGVAAVASLEVVGCGEDEIRTFVVEVFGPKLFSGGLRRFFRRMGVEIGWVRHGSSSFFLLLLLLTLRGTPSPPPRGILGINYLDSMIYRVLVSAKY
jgi:hypothetical protein